MFVVLQLLFDCSCWGILLRCRAKAERVFVEVFFKMEDAGTESKRNGESENKFVDQPALVYSYYHVGSAIGR